MSLLARSRMRQSLKALSQLSDLFVFFPMTLWMTIWSKVTSGRGAETAPCSLTVTKNPISFSSLGKILIALKMQASRADGRSAEQMRQLALEQGLLSNADG